MPAIASRKSPCWPERFTGCSRRLSSRSCRRCWPRSRPRNRRDAPHGRRSTPRVMAEGVTVRATFYTLTLACLLVQGFPHSARAALGGSADSVESDRVSMKGLIRPLPAGALQKQQLQLPSGTLLTEYLNAAGKVYAVTWHGPALPNLRQVLGNYFVNYQAAAQQPVVRHRLVRL